MNDHTDLAVIGLTGPSGAGKSTVAALFAASKIPVIDADAEYHRLLLPPSPCLDDLVRVFSPAILTEQRTLNRAALSALVFEDSARGKARLKQLNEITHFYIKQRINALIASHRDKAAALVIDAPLLIEADMCAACDLTVCVLAPTELRVKRLVARDRRAESEIRARVHAQPSDSFYREHTDLVIWNDAQTETEQLQAAVDGCLRRVGVLL